MTTIKLNVGGTIFETTRETLLFGPYFEALLNNKWKQNESIFIDRSPKLFEHVLCLLRDPHYNYPSKYSSELAFYGISCNLNDYRDRLEEVEHKVKIIINEIGFKKCVNCNELVIPSHKHGGKCKTCRKMYNMKSSTIFEFVLEDV